MIVVEAVPEVYSAEFPGDPDSHYPTIRDERFVVSDVMA